MKTSAYIYTGQYCDLASVRAFSACDRLVVLMPGEFTQEALPVRKYKYETAQELIALGADLVLQIPTLGTNLRMGLYVYALNSVLRRAGIIDELILPYVLTGEEDVYEPLRSFLFRSPQNYQKRLQYLQTHGVNTEENPAPVYEEFIPGAGVFASFALNRLAVELENAMILSYSAVKVKRMPITSDQLSQEPFTTSASAFLSFLKEQLASFDFKKAGYSMQDVFGGSESMENGLKEWLNGGRLPTEGRRTETTIRRYLIHALSGFRKSDHSICSLSGYTPYLEVLAGSEDLRAELKTRSWVPLKEEAPDTEVLLQKIEASVEELWNHQH